MLQDEIIKFPYRMYLLEIENDKISKMSNVEKMVLQCIYSRSCDGYVREKHIKALMSTEFPEWARKSIFKN